MTKVRYIRTLDYYDEPLVFEARDATGGRYIAAIGPSDETEYLVAGVSPEDLRRFCDGKTDLRTLLTASDPDSRYTTTLPSRANNELKLERFRGSLQESGFLPDPGFVLHGLPSAEDR